MKETMEDSLKYYNSILSSQNQEFWDWIVLKASNKKQAKSYEE